VIRARDCRTLLRAVRLPVVGLAAVVLAAACASAAPSSPSESSAPGSGAPGPTISATTSAASATSAASSAEPSPPSEPSAEAASPTPPLPTTAPASPVGPTIPPGSAAAAAAACTGTDANRAFYGAVAAAVAWPVYCPVLPAGWFVESGSYRLSGGARLEIVYKGPDGARLELHEGAFCADPTTCLPDGSDAGSTAFADREAALVAADDGSWSASLDDATGNRWLLVGSNLDEATFRGFAADLAIVAG
jgi:hypothetical protein